MPSRKKSGAARGRAALRSAVHGGAAFKRSPERLAAKRARRAARQAAVASSRASKAAEEARLAAEEDSLDLLRMSVFSLGSGSPSTRHATHSHTRRELHWSPEGR